MSMIKISELKKNFGNQQVLKGINLEIEAGKVVVLIGPSGCGKSTLLRCMNFLEEPSSGTIEINGTPLNHETIKDLQKQIGMVFQKFNLFPNLTILENLTLAPIQVLKMNKTDAENTAKKYLKKVGLLSKINAYPEQLSGGQQQRVAIARTLCMNPQILLFDEPTSALDPEMVNEVLDVIKELTKSGKTMILVTHEMSFAREIADIILFCDKGIILEQGSPEEIFDHPKQQRTMEFLSKILSTTKKKNTFWEKTKKHLKFKGKK